MAGNYMYLSESIRIHHGRPELNSPDTGLDIPAVILQLNCHNWSRRVMWHQRPLVAIPWRRQRDSAKNSALSRTCKQILVHVTLREIDFNGDFLRVHVMSRLSKFLATDWRVICMESDCLEKYTNSGKNLNGVAVQLATRDQKSATQIQNV